MNGFSIPVSITRCCNTVSSTQFQWRRADLQVFPVTILAAVDKFDHSVLGVLDSGGISDFSGEGVDFELCTIVLERQVLP